MLANFDTNVHPSGQHTGYYNDPDMLMVGLDGFTAAQNRSHMNPRAISGAPLLAGNNIGHDEHAARVTILTNPEVVAVDQDPRGLQGVKAAEDTTGLQVYSKVLSGTGKRAVVLLNRTSSAQNMTVRWSDLGLTGASATVRNLWTRYQRGQLRHQLHRLRPRRKDVRDHLTVTGGTAGGELIAVRPRPGVPTANTKGASSRWDCHLRQPAPAAPRWGTSVYGNKCLDANNRGTTNGTRFVTWDCNGQNNQLWDVNADGTITNGNAGLCLDSNGGGTANGTKLVLWTCNGNNNQKWTLS